MISSPRLVRNHEGYSVVVCGGVSRILTSVF